MSVFNIKEVRLVKSLMPQPAKILIWGALTQELQNILGNLGYRVRVGDTEVLTDQWPTSRLAISTKLSHEVVELCLLARVTPEVNILASLQRIKDNLSHQGFVVVTFSEGSESARLPRWREFWLSIGLRLGFEMVDKGDAHVTLKIAAVQPRWRLALASPNDWPQIGALFETVFKQNFDTKLWRWKYGEGRGHAVIAFRGDQVIAHYGGMYRDILLEGRREWAMQVGDVMVHPSQRAVWTRQGAFFQTCVTWAEMYGPLDFGFPSLRSMRLAQKLGIYIKAGRIVEIRWTVSKAVRRHFGTRLKIIDSNFGSIASNVDELWSAMSAELVVAAVGVRDWRWLHQRYLSHPSIRYQVIGVYRRWSEKLIGVFVLRMHSEECELLDLIGRIEDFPRLLGEANRFCALNGCKSLYLWISDAWSTHFLTSGAVKREIDLEIPTDGWTGSPLALELVDRWWLMGGDSDYR